MIIIETTMSLTQPYKVRYTKGENEFLAESKPLKSKKACFKNIYSMYKLFMHIYCDGFDGDIKVKDTTLENKDYFAYDICGIKKKAGVRK